MNCQRCGNKEAYSLSFSAAGCSCNLCGLTRSKGSPDVYFRRPYLDPHLVDVKDVRQKDGVWIESKRHKAEIMRNLNVVEAGDKRHGGRN